MASSPSPELYKPHSSSAWPVMVLAHNEERRITACLDSIYAADPSRSFEVFVMANGCKDNTEGVVREYGKRRPGVHVVTIELADYCNAWNVFIHDTIKKYELDSDVYFFMDGDCRACPGSFSVLANALAQDEQANAAGSRPMAGRSKEKDTRNMMQGRSFFANLYALKGRFVREVQRRGVRLPVGLEGDDGLLGALVKWDLDPRQEWNNNRIVPCADAGFTFDPVSPTDFRAWRTYWRRLVRYGRRRYEFDLLGPRLKRDGLAALPGHISEIYPDSGKLKLRWQGIYTLPNLVALLQLKKHAR